MSPRPRSGARTASPDPVRYSFFVKVVQSYARSPLARRLPDSARDQIAPLVPWRTEPDLYRTDLADRLPDGLAANPAPTPLAAGVPAVRTARNFVRWRLEFGAHTH
jgi:hypothetical protein